PEDDSLHHIAHTAAWPGARGRDRDQACEYAADGRQHQPRQRPESAEGREHVMGSEYMAVKCAEQHAQRNRKGRRAERDHDQRGIVTQRWAARLRTACARFRRIRRLHGWKGSRAETKARERAKCRSVIRLARDTADCERTPGAM